MRYKDGSALAEVWSCSFLECSAKSSYNVDQAFAEIVRNINYVQNARTKNKNGCCIII